MSQFEATFLILIPAFILFIFAIFLFYPETLSQSCKEGSVVNDHLGQRRVCRGGKLSVPCRVRKEWNGMLPGERWVQSNVMRKHLSLLLYVVARPRSFHDFHQPTLRNIRSTSESHYLFWNLSLHLYVINTTSIDFQSQGPWCDLLYIVLRTNCAHRSERLWATL